MALPSQAELERRLAAYQDLLEAAARQSDARFLAVFPILPPASGCTRSTSSTASAA